MAVKDIQRPNFSNYPAKVGDMAPKDLFNLIRVAVQYETQESSIHEATGWRGAIYKAVAGLFSSPEDTDPNINTVYAQTGNVLYKVLDDNGLIDPGATGAAVDGMEAGL